MSWLYVLWNVQLTPNFWTVVYNDDQQLVCVNMHASSSYTASAGRSAAVRSVRMANKKHPLWLKASDSDQLVYSS